MPSESVQVSEGDNGAGGVELVVTSPHWRLRVDWGQQLDPYELVHLASGRAVADESYCYQLTVSGPPIPASMVARSAAGGSARWTGRPSSTTTPGPR